ncbi:MAG TPA: HU family DNA-binding protein [Ignavibacteriales bacterium]|jgi:DNA-binding protein HU-beta|nr:HU family DNA-binding protein [Ignavibacteriales bacterium]
MRKSDIVDIIAKETGLTKLETEAVVDGFIKTIINVISEGKHIEIRGFGTFKPKLKKERIGRNPKTGEEVKIPAHYEPSFKISKKFKEVVLKEIKQN